MNCDARLFLLALACLTPLSGCDPGSQGCPDCAPLDGPCTRGECDLTTSLCVARPAHEGEDCDDSEPCTLADACQAGVCRGTQKDCTALDSECLQGACADGECYEEPRADGSACPSYDGPCTQGVCAAGSCTRAARSDGTPCNDSDWCTTGDACATGACTGLARDCSDGLACTADACDPGRNACTHAPEDGTCLIGGVCRTAGEPSPENPCQICDPSADPTAWTNADGRSCDDGRPCTDPDTCFEGACEGPQIAGCCAADLDCDDNLLCTADACAVQTGLCTNALEASACLIAARCFSPGQPKGANECEECVPNVNQKGWTPRTGVCNDGLFCTTGDTCQAGTCLGVPIVCDDGLACTQDTCDEAAGCVHTLAPLACLIDGVCHGTSEPRPGNPCQACMPALDPIAWSPQSDGSPCDDGAFCNTGETCESGQCSGGQANRCDDGLPCTQDSCDEAGMRCLHVLVPGTCVIEEQCFQAGAANPANVCEECRPSDDPRAWSPADGQACDDLDWCTQNDTCQSGTCHGLPRDCDDALACTADTCIAAKELCHHALAQNTCLIALECHAAGAPNPENGCEVCDPGRSLNRWSPSDGLACDDGRACTGPDACSASRCVGAPIAGCCTGPADCADNLACTDDVCDLASGECSNPLLEGTCLIDGSCRAAGDRNPAADCEACDPRTAPRAWTPRADGQACNDREFCTLGETCLSGACRGGQPNACDDALDCTDDTCDEGGDRCRHALRADRCLIGGTCRAAGEADPDSACLACEPALDTAGWSPRADGERCGIGCEWCQAGVCEDVTRGQDPFRDCPACEVCDGQGACDAAPDGTDPKDDCQTSDCTFAECQAGTCAQPAGTACPDLSPSNCAQAGCDGLGVCDQSHAPAAIGLLCRLASGMCDLEERCAGALTCPADGLRGAGEECRPAALECDRPEACDGSSKACPADTFEPAGYPCTDALPLNCALAGCDGRGTCNQAFDEAPETTPCDDANACTDPDTCDAAGLCLGASLVPPIDPASPTSATALCLTAGSNARSIIRLDLRAGGQPRPGASVWIESAQATWDGPVVASAARPGTYYRILRAGAAPGSIAIQIRARFSAGGCTGPEVALAGPTVRVVQAALAGTGACSPIDSNLRIRVVDAFTGAPLTTAAVLVGAGGGTPYEADFERVLAGLPPTTSNHAVNLPGGVLELQDHALALEGAQIVTAGAPGYEYITLFGASASDLVLPLRPMSAPPVSGQIDGAFSNHGSVNNDNFVTAGMVIPPLGLADLARFRFDSLLSEQEDCWRATNNLGGINTNLPANIYIPAQFEWITVVIPLRLDILEHRYKTIPVPVGSTGVRFVGLSGRTSENSVVDGVLNGGGLSGIFETLTLQKIGLLETDVQGDQHNVSLNVGTALNANVSCSLSNIPDRADSLCVALGDWSGGHGEGDLFLMGFGILPGGTGTITSVPATGAFSRIGYVGLGVAVYLDAETLPAEERWRASAASARLDRSGTAFGGSGGSLAFNDLLGVTPLTRSDRTFSWQSVATATSVHYTDQVIELVDSVGYTTAPCGPVEEQISQTPIWRVLTPGGTQSFSLPTLPATFPRAADGGLMQPGTGEKLRWAFGAYHLGRPSFDFNAFDFEAALDTLSHSSTNSQDF